MSKYIHKSHNVSVLLYHIVCPVKYRLIVFSPEVDKSLKEICLEIQKRFEIMFLEIGVDQNHVHFLIQSIPKLSVTTVVKTIKSITARKIFELHPDLIAQLWKREFWSDGYFVNTVSRTGSEKTIQKYVSNQGKQYGQYEVLLKQEDLFLDTP